MARQLAATLALLVIAALAIASGAAAAERLSVRSLFDVCDDKKPSGRHSCDEQKAWGKCDEKWFVDGNFCRKTCGKCVEFDPRTAELNLRRVMKQCALTDKRTADACIGMLTGDDDFISAGGKLVTHSRKTDSPAQPVDSTRESFLSVEELLESEAFMETLQVCKVDCLVAHSEDNLVHSLVETFLEKHGAKSEKLAETIFTAESVARILLDFFKHVGCSMEQFVSIVPKLYRTLLEHNPSKLLRTHPFSLNCSLRKK